MRKAIFDLGTNTFNLIVCDIFEDTFEIIHKETISVKLGEGGIQQGFIAPPAFARGIEAMHALSKKLQLFAPVDYLKAVATSAIRSAANGTDFVDQVFAQCQIQIEVINGIQEADLIYKGVLLSLPKNIQTPFLMMDIGGGSTEFIIGDYSRIYWRNSYPIGIARLLSQFEPSNPITLSQILEIEDFFTASLHDLFKQAQLYKIETLIGVSGSFESYVEILSYRLHQDHWRKPYTSLEIQISDTQIIHHKLIQSTLEERAAMQGLLPLRVDMMVLSSINIQYVLKKLNIQKLWVTSYSLKEGLLF